MIRGPTIVRVRNVEPSGINCCCFRCCTCLRLEVLKSEPGIIKLAQIILGLFCQSLIFNYGNNYAATIGSSFQSYMATLSSCLFTSTLLLCCYVFSQKSLSLLKSSLFETLFNSVAAFSIVTSCSYLGWAVYTILSPLYLSTPYFQVYPAMSAAYMIGTLLGILYAYDAYKSYKYFRGIM